MWAFSCVNATLALVDSSTAEVAISQSVQRHFGTPHTIVLSNAPTWPVTV